MNDRNKNSADRIRRSFAPIGYVTTLACLVTCSQAFGQYQYAPSYDYYRNDTAEGTIFGGALGAITGAVIGGPKNQEGGALIGAGVGALTGNLLGRNRDRYDEYHAANGAAAVANANRQAAAQAVTNLDLVQMTQAGLSEHVIASTIRARGARLDLSPQGLIALKQSGVSDRVLLAAQDMSRGYAPPQPPTTIVRERPAAVIVTRPPVHWMYHHPPHYRSYRPHHYPHRHRRAGFSYHFRY